jgi:hypothetical protein
MTIPRTLSLWNNQTWLTDQEQTLSFVHRFCENLNHCRYLLSMCTFIAAASGEQFWIGELKRFWNIWWTKYQSTSLFIFPSSLSAPTYLTRFCIFLFRIFMPLPSFFFLSFAKLMIWKAWFPNSGLYCLVYKTNSTQKLDLNRDSNWF